MKISKMLTSKYQSEYRIWSGMKGRCLNPKNSAYKYYGGRGIKVCQEWIESFECFMLDMGRRPSKKHSIERKDNNWNYTPENCVWATKAEQANNTRANCMIKFDGCLYTPMELARLLASGHEVEFIHGLRQEYLAVKDRKHLLGHDDVSKWIQEQLRALRD